MRKTATVGYRQDRKAVSMRHEHVNLTVYISYAFITKTHGGTQMSQENPILKGQHHICIGLAIMAGVKLVSSS